MSQFHIAVIGGRLRQYAATKLLARLAPAEFTTKQVQMSDLSLYKQDVGIEEKCGQLLQGWMDQCVAWNRAHAQ